MYHHHHNQEDHSQQYRHNYQQQQQNPSHLEQQQQQRQHLQRLTQSQFSYHNDGSSTVPRSQTVAAGCGGGSGKDLIIRMLAEVFQVVPSVEASDGQVRWRQLSSNLVPISLYSRTTGSWLQYLLAASTSLDQESTGRQHQTQPSRLSSSQTMPKSSAMSPDSRNFLLLLQQFHHQQQRLGNQNLGAGSGSNRLVFQVIAHDFVQGGYFKILNTKLVQPGTRLGQASDHFVYWKAPVVADTRSQQLLHQTWGLNFASVNDAKLFFDICSLNLVDLDFNSDYLRQLAATQRPNQFHHHQQYYQQQQQQHLRCDIPPTRGARLSSDQHQVDPFDQLHLADAPCCSASGALDRQMSNRGKARRRLQTDESFEPSSRMECPVHQQVRPQDQKQVRRTRSRSSGRREMGQMSDSHFRAATNSLNKSRSISAPGSPKREESVKHNPRCQAMLRKQKLHHQQDSGPRPKKPARGVMRLGVDQEAAASVESGTTPRKCWTNSLPRTKNNDQQFAMELTMTDSLDQQQLAVSNRQPDMAISDRLTAKDSDIACRFTNSRSSGRRSTGVDARLVGDSFTSGQDLAELPNSETARMARMRYANSRREKEFLSLDVGVASSGKMSNQQQQRATAHLVALNERLQQQQQQLQQQLQLQPPKNNLLDQTMTATSSVEAATTTEDLPIDPVSRRRLFRPSTSSQSKEEQPISERSEPPSSTPALEKPVGQLSTDGKDDENNYRQLRQFNNNQMQQQTGRAVSLGPELGRDGMETTMAGSRGGRRRSLERTSCVDLDVMSMSRLIHLETAREEEEQSIPQRQDIGHKHSSVSRGELWEPEGGSQNYGPNREEAEENSLLIELERDQQRRELELRQQQQSSSLCRCSTSGKSPKTVARSTTTTTTATIDRASRVSGGRPLASRFKSAPDVSVPIGAELEGTCWGSSASAHGKTTYAVPLAAPIEGQLALQLERERARQLQTSLSCPSSLRRQRRRRARPSSECFQQCCCGRSQDWQSCRNWPTADWNSSSQFPNEAGHPSCLHCAPHQDYHDHFCHHQHQHQHQQHHHNHNHHEECQRTSMSRTVTSLANRSRRPQSGWRCSCCGGASTDNLTGHAPRAESPSSSGQPVDGYDQTMARTALKSRLRARSRPSSMERSVRLGSSGSPNRKPQQPQQQPNHASASRLILAKSMENVEKLIREVQLELEALRRQPAMLAATGSRPSTSGVVTTIGVEQQTEVKLTEEQHQQQSQARSAKSTSINRIKPNGPDDATSADGEQRTHNFRCVGAIRKAGFLSVKKWIVKRRSSIELARKQAWRRYWACLRGTSLLFYPLLDDAGSQSDGVELLTWIRANCGSSSSQLNQETDRPEAATFGSGTGQPEAIASLVNQWIEREPRHLILVEGSIAQPIKEHPKREHVFCLSTALGDAYLFQASCQPELDSWIGSLHNACAGSLARELGRDEATKLFQQRIRELELEADKKLFLRQRLESRLASMSSMVNLSSILQMGSQPEAEDTRSRLSRRDNNNNSNCDGQQQELLGGLDTSGTAYCTKLSLRSLLHRLNQQLMALDAYLEQVHSEMFQLRCYLASCSGRPLELPAPRSLLMQASKATKLLLVKMGVFTTSSFHAYVHARLGSAEQLLERLQRSPGSGPATPPRRSQSMSDSLGGLLASSAAQNSKLESNAEQLIELSNLSSVEIRVNRKLASEIVRPVSGCNSLQDTPSSLGAGSSSDDRFSVSESHPDWLAVRLRLLASSNAMDIIRLVIGALRHGASGGVHQTVTQIEALEYFLSFQVSPGDTEQEATSVGHSLRYVARRRDTISDWQDHVNSALQLERKSSFRLEVSRDRSLESEGSLPFGMAVTGSLIARFVDNFRSSRDQPNQSDQMGGQLAVFVAYVEWGSVAERAGLCEDDELLVVNEAPVADLDMLFVEKLMAEERQLRLLVRSSRIQHPMIANPVSTSRFQRPPSSSGDDDGDNNPPNNNSKGDHSDEPHHQQVTSEAAAPTNAGSFGETQKKLLSDEYISGLDCPPPPPPLETCEQPMTMDRQISQQASFGRQHPPMLSNNNNNQTRTSFQDEAQINSGNTNNKSFERLKRAFMELLDTERTYVDQLDYVQSHYMVALEEADFLSISELRQVRHVLNTIGELQTNFLSDMESCLLKELVPSSNLKQQISLDELIAESCSPGHPRLGPMLIRLARLFVDRADHFRIYASYCAHYSRLQRRLHPGLANCSEPLISPPPLDTFLSSSSGAIGCSTNTTNAAQSQLSRIQRTLSSITGSKMAANSSQVAPVDERLARLNDFLSSLAPSSTCCSSTTDSSSSGSAGDQGTNKSLKIKSPFFGVAVNPSGHQQTLESYLIKPLLRIVRYPMLLNSIASTFKQVVCEIIGGSDILEQLSKSVGQMEAIASYVNDTQRIQDQFGILFVNIERQFVDQTRQQQPIQGQSTFSVSSSKRNNDNQMRNAASPASPTQRMCPPVSLSIEHLLHWGSVEWLNVGQFKPNLKSSSQFACHLFVFESCVVFVCKELILNVKIGQLSFHSSRPTPSSRVSTFVRPKPIETTTAGPPGQPATEVLRYQTIIPVGEVQVRSVAADKTNLGGATNGAINGNAFQWELFRCSSTNSNSSLLTNKSKSQNQGKVYLFASPTNEARSSFLRKIRLIIRDSVRRMSLPVARSPSNKSTTPPKKLSNPTSITALGNNTEMSSTLATNSASSSIANSQPNSLSPELRAQNEMDLIATSVGVGSQM